MNRSTPSLPVHHQLPEFTQTHVHRVGDATQPSHPLLSPSPPAPNPSQHQGLSNESPLHRAHFLHTRQHQAESASGWEKSLRAYGSSQVSPGSDAHHTHSHHIIRSVIWPHSLANEAGRWSLCAQEEHEAGLIKRLLVLLVPLQLSPLF